MSDAGTDSQRGRGERSARGRDLVLIRSLAGFVVLLACVGIGARAAGAPFDPTILWLDLRPLPPLAGSLLLALLATSLCAVAVGFRGRWVGMIPLLVALIALANAATFYRLLATGTIRTDFPLPFTLVTAAALLTLALAALRRPLAVPRRHALLRTLATIAAISIWFAGFALLQMWCFGKTDYVRPADAIVVFGARAYADGRPSDALADRVRTGAELFHEGRAPRLIMSGGPGDGPIDEPTAMRNYAVSLGVPAEAIVQDSTGLNTAATLDYLRHAHADEQMVAVSHFYHLPRVKFAAEQRGLRLTTSPARERYTLSQLPANIAREVAAFWVYLVRG